MKNNKESWFDNEEFGDITQKMLEIAEQKRPLEEWNQEMNNLYNFVDKMRNAKLLDGFTDELFTLVDDEDLDDDRLREASENLLPSLCDALKDAGYGTPVKEN